MTIATGTRSRRSRRNWSSTRFSTSGIRRSSTTFISRARLARVCFCRPTCSRSSPTCRDRSSKATPNSAIISRKEMRATGFKGITTDSTYDAWSPSRAYSHYHGGVRILQETARAVWRRRSRLSSINCGRAKVTIRAKRRANFGPVWQGGEWHLRDITNTMTTVGVPSAEARRAKSRALVAEVL